MEIVVDRDRGVVHQDPDGECQPAQGHHVERLSQRREADDRAQHRERNRGRDNERAAPAPQEEEDHERREAGGDERLADDPRDRGADEHRLVHEHLNVEGRRQRGLERDEQRLHAVDHREARGIPVLEHAHVGAMLSVLAHDVGLDAGTVAHIRDVADVDHRPVDLLDRHVVELRDDLGARVQAHAVFPGAQARRSGGQDHVLRVDGGAHVRRRKPLRIQARQIKVDVDQPGRAPVGERNGRALGGRERRAHEVGYVVVQVGLRHRAGAHADLEDRHVGRVEAQDDGRRDPRRQNPGVALGCRSELGNARRDVRGGLKEHLDHRDAVERL